MKFPPNFLDNYPKIDWKSPHYYSIMRFSKMQLRNIWRFLYHTSWKLHSNFGLTSAHDAVLTSPQQATKLSPVARIQCLQFMFLQTTDMSKADICTKHGTSHSRYILISWVSHQELEGTETVLFQANKSAKQLTTVWVTPVHLCKDTWWYLFFLVTDTRRYFQPWLCGPKEVFQGKPWRIPSPNQVFFFVPIPKHRAYEQRCDKKRNRKFNLNREKVAKRPILTSFLAISFRH